MPQCKFLGVDPGITNKKLYEESLGGQFIYGSIEGYEEKINISTTDTKIGFNQFLLQYFQNKTIDLMLIDIEWSEYKILPTLADYKSDLPPICQFNVELHWPPQRPVTTIHEAIYMIMDNQSNVQPSTTEARSQSELIESFRAEFT
uniref:Methyltransferase FkbM domain-containing protein n=1 Tax=Acrobeloides nanus TaxID=290746 RepID=A0A914DRH1_9BILA